MNYQELEDKLHELHNQAIEARDAAQKTAEAITKLKNDLLAAEVNKYKNNV